MSETPGPLSHPFSQHAESDDTEALSKKRKRPNDWLTVPGHEDITATLQSTTMIEDMNPVEGMDFERAKRDDEYYFEDGSCIFLVQDTLFNVHRSILSRDHSSFRTMFALPQGGSESEGRSDDRPIVLLGDTPSEFRHFLWALYALPPELRSINSPGSDLTQLIDIARISNKYSFKTLETWSLDAIQEYVNRKPSPILNAIPSASAYCFSHDISTADVMSTSGDTNIESSAQLTRLIRLAQMCSHERLLNAMISILRGLMSSSLQYAYLAMTLSDELDLRALRGAAYMEVMQKAAIIKNGTFDIPKRPPPKPTLPNAAVNTTGTSSGTTASTSSSEGAAEELIINSAQQLRLLIGYYRLTRTWERLRTTPPHFDHSPSCNATWHQHGCTQSWLEFWKDKTKGESVVSLGLADVTGRLRQVQKEYDRWGSATYMHHECKAAARRAIIDTTKIVEDALPDYFSEGGVDD